MEGLRSRKMRKPNQMVKVEIEEEFCAVMENIKSEETTTNYDVYDYEIVPLPLRCRLCTIPNNDNMVDIFNCRESEKDILNMIKHCLPIVVRETDTLPKRVCRFCLEKLDLCFQFRESVIDAEQQLLTLDIQERVKLDETEGNSNESCRNMEHDDIEKTLKTSPNTSIEVPDTDKLNKMIQQSSGVPRTPHSRIRTRKKAISDTHCGKDFENVKQENLAVNEESHIGGTHASVTLITSEDSRNRVTELETLKGIDNPEYCGKKFTSEVEENHRYQDPKQSYECRICKKTFDTFRNLKLHKRVHLENGLYRCPICDGLFKKERSFRLHMLAHTHKTSWKCEYCKKCYSSKHHLNRHLHEYCKNHPDIERKLFKCIFCGKPFRSEKGLYEHMKLHTGEGLYICEYCGKKFPSESRRGLHHRAVHTTERPFECFICKKTFSQSSKMREHAFLYH